MNIQTQKTSTLAIASLICGILGLTVMPLLGSLCAIVTGHMARADIRANPQTLEGDGLAVSGLILGWLSIAILVIGILVLLLFFGGIAVLGSFYTS